MPLVEREFARDTVKGKALAELQEAVEGFVTDPIEFQYARTLTNTPPIPKSPTPQAPVQFNTQVVAHPLWTLNGDGSFAPNSDDAAGSYDVEANVSLSTTSFTGGDNRVDVWLEKNGVLVSGSRSAGTVRGFLQSAPLNFGPIRVVVANGDVLAVMAIHTLGNATSIVGGIDSCLVAGRRVK